MNDDRLPYPFRFKPVTGLFTILLASLLLSACSPTPTPTPFVPPKAAPPTQPIIQTGTPVGPTSTPEPESFPSPTATSPCTDELAFLSDITIPDGSVVQPGTTIEKEWLVQNSGSCNWDGHYRFKFVGGDSLGAAAEQALYPARSGTQAVLTVTFTAPSEPGEYASAWQAFNPNDVPFGDAVFMVIVIE